MGETLVTVNLKGNQVAIVRHMELHKLDVNSSHTETDCTYSIVHDKNGVRYLQIDTYGSNERKIAGKKSQSVRFAPEAIRELLQVINTHFSDQT